MKRSIFTILSALCTLGASAQLVNNGATITVQAGATLMVESNVENQGVGVINLEGNAIMEIKGNFTNANGLAGINASPTSKVILNGAAAATFNAGGDTIANLEIAKTAAGDVTMAGNAVISKELSFNSGNLISGKLILGANTLTIGANATAIGADVDEYIVTNDPMGKVAKEFSASAPFIYPVGDVSNFTPLTSTPTGTFDPTGDVVAVNVVNSAKSPLPSGTDANLTRYWNVDQTGITGAYGNTLVGTFIPTTEDIVGTASKIKGAVHNGTTWSHVDAAGAASTVTGWTNDNAADFTGTNSFGRVNVFAALAGATPVVNAGNPSGFSMSTNLNSILPTSTPYNVAPWNAPIETGIITPNVVDWVLVEARDAATPTTILGSRSALLLSNGSIVNPDGTALTVKDATPSSHIAIKHRNHLAIRTATTKSVIPTSSALLAAPVPSPTINFASTPSDAYTNPANTTNANMKAIGSTGIFAMWAGDVNNDSKVRYIPITFPSVIPADALVILNLGLGGNASGSLSNVYNKYDTNFDRSVRYVPITFPSVIPSDALFYLNNTLGGVSNIEYNSHN
jgi:hypothetical protein